MKLSQRLARLSDSKTIAMTAAARALRATGKDVISLSIGEPDFATPEPIKQAALEAIRADVSHYPPIAGFPDLRLAIAGKFQRDNGLHYEPECVMASTGAKQCLVNVLMALLDAGDEVVIPAPYWVSYPDMVRLAEGVPVPVFAGVDQGFKITAAQLRQAITPRTRALMLNSPSNPTGAVYSREELQALAGVLQAHPDIVVIADEIYEHIRFGVEHVSFATLEGMFERTVTINGVSKAFAMTGWRLGYLGGPKVLVDACLKIQGQMTSGANAIAQKAAAAALNADPAQMVAPMVARYRRRRDAALAALSDIPGIVLPEPDGAFYLFADVSGLLGRRVRGHNLATAEDIAMLLLNEALVATVAGDAFGAPGCLRLSVATDDLRLAEACERISLCLSAAD